MERFGAEEVRREDDTEESETEELKRPRGHLPRIPSKCQGLPVLGTGRRRGGGNEEMRRRRGVERGRDTHWGGSWAKMLR